MKQFILLISFLLFSFFEANACSCADVPEAFDRHIKANHIIFAAKVLAQIEIPNDSSCLMIYHGLTQLKVTKWFQNKMQSDTIYYANGHGGMCISSIEHLKVGDEVIVKAYEERYLDPGMELYSNPDLKLINFLDDYRSKPIVSYDICDVSLLDIKNNKVIGAITKNHGHRKWRFIQFIRRISKGWADKMQDKWRNEKPKYQEWDFRKFNRLMKRKWNALT